MIVKNKILPFGNYVAINLFGFIFTKRESLTERTINHEDIHTKQMKELLWVPFYIWYVIEYLIRLIQFRDTNLAYRNISFEHEAYDNDNDLFYLDSRKKFNFINYL